jgi:zinc D-Ala-D-Ala carboxypeptidase
MNWDKYHPFFKPQEFTCKCGCGLLLHEEEHMDLLLKLRKTMNIPLVINSGTRCRLHNDRSGGVPSSDHLVGNGTDIKCLDPRTRRRMVKALLDLDCPRILIHKSFVHVGTNPDNPQNILSLY